MKILNVILTPRFSGAEILVRDLTYQLIENNYSVGIAALNPTENDFEPVLNSLAKMGVALFSTKKKLNRHERISFITDTINTYKPQIILSHSVIPILYSQISLISKIKIKSPYFIPVLHSVDDYKYINFRLLELLLGWRSNRIVGVSRESGSNYNSRYPWRKKKVVEIPNGLDIQKFRIDYEKRQEQRSKYGITDEEKILIQVGRISPVKRQHLSLEAIIPIMQDKSNLKLWFVGVFEDEYYYNRLLEQVIVSKLEERIIFWGGSLEISNFLNVADVFLMPSEREAQGIAFLEALVAGIGIVASDIPSFEFARDEPGVWLVDPSLIQNYRDEINRVIGLENGLRYHRALDNFDITHSAKLYYKLFEDLVHKS